MRKRTGGKSNKVPVAIWVAAAACVIALVAVVLCFYMTADNQGEFIPPPFDSEAQPGVPEGAEALGWAEIWQEGMDFKAGVCGAFVVEDNSVDVWFTNLSENEAWLKLCVTDEAGNILGETGIIKSGEYVRSVALDIIPENGAAITLKVMAYEPETYYSLGAVRLNTTAIVE